MRLLFLSLFLFTLMLPAHAAERIELPEHTWTFSGPLGKFDQNQLQRGFQVYREVCATCHSLSLIAFRNLADLGYNEDEIKAIAASYEIKDGPNDMGEMFTRPGRPSDHFPDPFPNRKAAEAANNGAYPPDLSLMTKARHGGEPLAGRAGARDEVFAQVAALDAVDRVRQLGLEPVQPVVDLARLPAGVGEDRGVDGLEFAVGDHEGQGR